MRKFIAQIDSYNYTIPSPQIQTMAIYHLSYLRHLKATSHGPLLSVSPNSPRIPKHKQIISLSLRWPSWPKIYVAENSTFCTRPKQKQDPKKKKVITTTSLQLWQDIPLRIGNNFCSSSSQIPSNNNTPFFLWSSHINIPTPQQPPIFFF